MNDTQREEVNTTPSEMAKDIAALALKTRRKGQLNGTRGSEADEIELTRAMVAAYPSLVAELEELLICPVIRIIPI